MDTKEWMQKNVKPSRTKQLIEMVKKHPIITTLLIFIALSGTAIGTWIVMANSSYVATVTSTEDTPLQTSIDFSNIVIDTTQTDMTAFTSAEFENLNGLIENILVDITVNSTDNTTDSCTDYESDCSVEIYFEGSEIVTSDLINISSGTNTFNSSVQCDHLSCPQTIDVTLSLTG